MVKPTRREYSGSNSFLLLSPSFTRGPWSKDWGLLVLRWRSHNADLDQGTLLRRVRAPTAVGMGTLSRRSCAARRLQPPGGLRRRRAQRCSIPPGSVRLVFHAALTYT